ncbi:MAG: alpha-ribazole-5-phosphate synthase [Clostridium sp.]|uniref:alpha-ribazole-5-phosphate synthase n=1 Tax=Clostridium sp. TaxID=1506 RepID=UPI0039EB2CBF
MEVRKIRDLSLISIDEERIMVIACDSCGGIGVKEGDTLKVPTIYVARFTVRVAIMEVICSGAEIITITNAVCNEMKDTGIEVIKGIKEELRLAGIDDIALTGSTEENFKTISTGIGITAIGMVSKDKLKVNSVKEEAIIVSIGIPKVGDEIDLVKDAEIVDYVTLYKLQQSEYVYEIVPVGSKGIAYEAEMLAKNNGFKVKFNTGLLVDIHKSGGPSTCVIAAVNSKKIGEIIKNFNNVNIIAYLVKN